MKAVVLMGHAMECPFCGSKEVKVIDADSEFWVSCGRCGANGPSGKTEAEALEHWNWSGNAMGGEEVNGGGASS